MMFNILFGKADIGNIGLYHSFVHLLNKIFDISMEIYQAIDPRRWCIISSCYLSPNKEVFLCLKKISQRNLLY